MMHCMHWGKQICIIKVMRKYIAMYDAYRLLRPELFILRLLTGEREVGSIINKLYPYRLFGTV